MKRVSAFNARPCTSRRVMLVASLALTACGSSRTTDNPRAQVAPGAGIGPPSLYIDAVLAPPPIRAMESCIYIPDPSLPSLSAGRLDMAFATQYTPGLLVGNATTADGGIEAARMAITGVDVHVTDLAGSPIADVHNDASSFIDGAECNLPGYATVSATLLDSAAVAAATRSTTTVRVIAHVTALAKDAYGDAVRSMPFDFPIDLCAGCLVTSPPAPATCADPPDTNFVPCVVGQDQPIDCRTCQPNPACHL